MVSDYPVYVTRPSLCALDDYKALLERVWLNGVLTNNGEFVKRFESELGSYLGARNIVAVSNGTIALQLAIRALGLKGEIITTPFTWIATYSAIQWEGCQPVFVDIDRETFNIDPDKIKAAITDNTVAIMPVHVFSNPCNIQKISEIADQYGLRTIYDGAHAVGVNYNGSSILRYGDISTVSFHATKILNTAEGGGCVTDDMDLFIRLKKIRSFDLEQCGDDVDLSTNAKMSELQAALGICNLNILHEAIKSRKNLYFYYKELLSFRDDLTWQNFNENEYNYSYMPIVFESESIVERVIARLNEMNIFPRRYFYPALSDLCDSHYCIATPIASDISRRIVCMPLYQGLSHHIVEKICEIILSVLED